MKFAMFDPLASQLDHWTDIQSVLEFVLCRSLEMCEADFGNVQLMNWQAGHLEIKAQRGFHKEFLNFFDRVKLGGTSACARALGNRRSIIVEDVMEDPQFLYCRAIVRRAGVRAVQSTPLASSSGAIVGIVSTHFTECHRPTEIQMRSIADAAQSAADAIIHIRANGSHVDRVKNSIRSLQESRDAIARADSLLSGAANYFAAPKSKV